MNKIEPPPSENLARPLRGGGLFRGAWYIFFRFRFWKVSSGLYFFQKSAAKWISGLFFPKIFRALRARGYIFIRKSPLITPFSQNFLARFARGVIFSLKFSARFARGVIFFSKNLRKCFGVIFFSDFDFGKCAQGYIFFQKISEKSRLGVI